MSDGLLGGDHNYAHLMMALAMLSLIVYLRSIGDTGGLVITIGAVLYGEVVYQNKQIREAE